VVCRTAGWTKCGHVVQGFNALVAVNAAGSSLPLLGKGKLPPPGAPLSASMKSTLFGFVRSNKDALQLFVQGATHEQSRYPLDLSLGIETPLPHLGKFRNANQLLQVSAIVHAEANEGLNAANDVLIALALTRSLETEPVLFSQMVRATSVSAAVGALEQTVNRVALPIESLSELSKAFQHIEAWTRKARGLPAASSRREHLRQRCCAPRKNSFSLWPRPGWMFPPNCATG